MEIFAKCHMFDDNKIIGCVFEHELKKKVNHIIKINDYQCMWKSNKKLECINKNVNDSNQPKLLFVRNKKDNLEDIVYEWYQYGNEKSQQTTKTIQEFTEQVSAAHALYKNLDIVFGTKFIKKDLNAVKKELSDMKEWQKYVKKELSDMKKDITDVKKDITDVKKDIIDVKKDITELKKDINDFRKDINDFRKEVIGLIKKKN